MFYGRFDRGVTNIEDFHLDADILSYYPFNLAAAVYCHRVDFTRLEVIKKEEVRQRMYDIYPPAIIKTLETLTEKEQKILHLRFQSGLTQEQVGKILGVTKERIRQIEDKALQKLRHPRHWKYWKKDTMNKVFEVAEERDRLRLKNLELKSKLTEILNIMGLEEDEKSISAQEDESSVYLEELNLSARTYNLLHRAGIIYLSDFDKWTMSELKKIRNLGPKSITELFQKLQDFGIEIDDQ